MPASVLPRPDNNALEHSARVVSALHDQIAQSGCMPFGDYMQLALYGNGLGYYVTGNEVIGAAGDFVTAPLVSPLFGSCIAQQCAQALSVCGDDILEFGAGTGALASSVLNALLLIDALPSRYLILEPSASLASRQQTLLQSTLSPALFDRIEWVTKVPAGFTGVVLANEVLDAMPVERFVISGPDEPATQIFIDSDGNGLHYTQQPAQPAVASAVLSIQQSLPFRLPKGYCSEVNLLLAPWLKSLADAVHQGLVLLIDYGYPRTEYYIQERNKGTLRCYYRHHMHEDALLYPGLQDITADVDFTRVAEAAHGAGFDLHGYTSQAQFLLGNGLAEHAVNFNASSDSERYQLSQQVNTLSMGDSMGDRFQVMALSKSLDIELDGFKLAEFSHRL